MKKYEVLPIILGTLLLLNLLSSCSSTGEENQPTTAVVESTIMVPTPEAPRANAAAAVTVSPTTHVAVAATEELSVATTEVNSVIIAASEAPLYSGPGKDYPVIAIAFGGSNYPVTGISEDELWWRLTCYDDAFVLIEACWLSTDPSVSTPTESTAMLLGSEIQPYIELTFDFLRAVQSGLTASGSEAFLSHDLQAIVEAGRPLPTLFGVRDAFPSFVMTDFSDPRAKGQAQVRVRFNYESPNYAIISLIEEEGEWQIDKVAAHNLVKTFGTGELMQAESVIIAYFEALAMDKPEVALDLLTPDFQDSIDPQDLALAADGLNKLTVATLQPVRSTADQLVYYVRLLAVPDGTKSTIGLGDWREGENARWLTMVHNEDGWRIAQITSSLTLSEIASWQRVNILPINMLLDVPADWTRAGLQWAWSPNSMGLPGLGIKWAELGDFGGDETLLPRYRRELSKRPIDLGWASGNQYTFELMGGPGEGSIGTEMHMIVQTGRRAYDFYASATDIEGLEDMQPILQRMVAAVAITDPQASAFKSVEAAVNFLATLLRDGTGASSLPYLSDELRDSVSDQSSLLSLLGTDLLFQSFHASWLENPVVGQALVDVTLNFDDSTKELVFTVQRNADDLWLITEIEPLD